MCQHIPTCPSAAAPDREAARVVSGHPEQGWSLLCNGVILFEDTGELLPDRSVVTPHRGCAGQCDETTPLADLIPVQPQLTAA